jgi:RND family efflux transporter MFP subunit
VEPFECADLYAKASGFLVEMKVDIGSRVNEKDILARISVPEYEKQVDKDKAEVERAGAKRDQTKAAITTAEKDHGAASAGVALAQAEFKSKTSFREYRQKQRDRIAGLVAQQALNAKLAEEQEDQLQAAISAELASTESVNAARQKEAAATARVEQAKADLKLALAEIEVAKAQQAKSQVLLDYCVIRSPYTGVVTRRSYHVGDFVRSAEAGGERGPLFSVERTDVMRVVVMVPERDVPFVTIDDPAVIELDALPGLEFKSKGESKVAVSRLAESEDVHNRMMRTEIDVPNPDRRLRRGMYGRVTMMLESGTPGSVRVPSAALVGKAEGGKGSVRVVRGDTVHLVPIRFGADNGVEVEILSGVTKDDRVVVRANGTVEEGTRVTVTDNKPAAGH